MGRSTCVLKSGGRNKEIERERKATRFLQGHLRPSAIRMSVLYSFTRVEDKAVKSSVYGLGSIER